MQSGAKTKSDFYGAWAQCSRKQLISMLLAGEDLFEMKSIQQSCVISLSYRDYPVGHMHT